MTQTLRRLTFPTLLLLLLGASSCIVPVGYRRGRQHHAPAYCHRGPAITLGAVAIKAPSLHLRF